jgi:DNA polymerase III delta prime subunit
MDRGIDILRTKIMSFASTVSLSDSGPKLVILDECLHEEETVRIGTVDSYVNVALKDLAKDTVYPVVSFNMESGSFENDTGAIISDKEDDLFEVVLSCGRKVVANSKHPFICKSADGSFYERTIEQDLIGHDVVTV